MDFAQSVADSQWRSAGHRRHGPIQRVYTDGDGAISDDENFNATRNEFTAAVAAGKYPFLPAHVLNSLTKGEPNELTRAVDRQAAAPVPRRTFAFHLNRGLTTAIKCL